MRARFRAIAALALLLVAGACGVRTPTPAAPLAAPLVWPNPPAEARIRYVRSVSGPKDAGIQKSFFGRLADTVFVADSWVKKVFQVNREGKLLRVAAETGLERPAAVAYDEGSGRLYVADSAGHRVAAYGPDGALLLSWGKRGIEDGEFNHP